LDIVWKELISHFEKEMRNKYIRIVGTC